MKTMKFRLLATIITLAAVIATTNSNAQRRSTSDNNNDNRKVENTRSANKRNIEKKSGSHENANESRATSRSVKSYPDVRRSSTSTETRKQATPKAGEVNQNRSGRQNNSINENRTRTENRERPTSTSNRISTNQSNTKEKEIGRVDDSRRSTGVATDNNRNSKKEIYNRNRNVNVNNSERYNLNANDARYRPTRDYRGSDKYWSSDFRGENRNNISNRKYNYNKYNHWDHRWEGYRWNNNSWRNYYGYYNPYSYRNNKYYYHHNYYGHVIRKFTYHPQIFIHNHIKYYSYDGNFFRYRSGVGYVLVDIPFGMAFDNLPNNYEQVYINGYLYFRIGNLFFEHTNYGFQLVHYPERYFAYDDGDHNDGFRFNDMNY